MIHDYNPNADQREQLIQQQLAQLRAERFAHHINVTRWTAIPPSLQDGSEADAIAAARHAMAVLEAQIDALSALARGEDTVDA